MLWSSSSSWRRRWIVVVVALLVMHKTARADFRWSNVCGEAPMKGFPFCNTSLSWDERVVDYARRVPTRQQMRMMIDTAAGVPALHIPPYNWWSEGLHGPLQPCVCDSRSGRDPDTACKCPTSFPCPSALGNALNDTLWRRVGATIGRQARAIYNVRHHQPPSKHDFGRYNGLTYWSPTINLQRDPRWGRNMEVPGEDPLVVAHYAREFVQGLQYGINTNHQGKGAATTTIHQVGACCKHLIANSLEGHPKSNISRHDFNALVSPDDLANYYMPPFQACVEAGSVGLMCSYNAVNGLPSCANPSLLQDVVRTQWNFTGYIVSDCGALQDIVEGHHLGTNLTAAAALALKASTDLNCGIVYTSYLPQALASGFITPQDINTSFQRLAKVQMQLGLFDHHSSSDNSSPQHAFLTYGIHDIDTPEDQQLALQAAQQSIVLLQNYNQTLPLQAPIAKLAVIGPHIVARQVFMSNYHGERCLYGSYDCIPTPLSTVRTANRGGTTVSSLGCHVQHADVNKIDDAVAVAKTADTIIMFLGIDTSIEDEGMDRTETTLPGLQLQLLDRILDLGLTRHQRLVVVLIHGGTLSLGSERVKRIPALLSAPYGGQAAAQAMADVLFGSYNPTGKLAATVYPPNYVHQIPITEMGLQVGVGRTHMYYKKRVEFAFGHGLSYSQWHVEWQDQGPLHWNVQDPPLLVNVTVTNHGPHPGAQTVLLVWRPKTVSSIRQKLIGFQESRRVLKVGEEFEASFVVDAAALGVANPKGKKVVTPGQYTLVALAAGISTEMNLVVSDDNSSEMNTSME